MESYVKMVPIMILADQEFYKNLTIARIVEIKSFVWQEESLMIATLVLFVLQVLIPQHLSIDPKPMHVLKASTVVQEPLFLKYAHQACLPFIQELSKWKNAIIANPASIVNMEQLRQKYVQLEITAQ